MQIPVQKINATRLQSSSEKQLRVSSLNLNSIGELTINFSKPILNLDLDKRILQDSKAFQYKIEDIFNVRVEDEDEDDRLDKLIRDITLVKVTDTAIVMKITFNDLEALTIDLKEPDTLLVSIILPEVIIDA